MNTFCMNHGHGISAARRNLLLWTMGVVLCLGQAAHAADPAPTDPVVNKLGVKPAGSRDVEWFHWGNLPHHALISSAVLGTGLSC